MAQFELVKFIDPSDNTETFAQFSEDRSLVAVYTSQRTAEKWFKIDDDFDPVAAVLIVGGDYAEAVKVALDTPAYKTA